MSRGVRRNALVDASERYQKERLGLLSVNEKDLGTIKRPAHGQLGNRATGAPRRLASSKGLVKTLPELQH